MTKFPVDAPKARVIKALERLGFRLVREREHVAMIRDNLDGTRTPLTMPNHQHLKSSTLRLICTQAGISRGEFLDAYQTDLSLGTCKQKTTALAGVGSRWRVLQELKAVPTQP